MFVKNSWAIVLLFICCNSKAVLLKDGTSAPEEKVNRVYDILQKLQQNSVNGTESEKNMRYLIFDLWYGSAPSSLKLAPQQYYFGRYPFDNNIAERFDYAHQLGLCDSEGNMDEEAARIIRCSVYPVFKAPRVPLWVDVRSPISWLAWAKKSLASIKNTIFTS